MSNVLNPYSPEYWAKVAQEIYQPKAIYRQVASFRAEPIMKNGDVFHRVLPSVVPIQPYQRYSTMTPSSISGTDQSLTVNLENAFIFQVDDLDQVQANLALGPTYSSTAIIGMNNVIDSSMLGQVVNATSVVDNGTLTTGTPDGLPITLNGSNVAEVFSLGKQKLAEQNIDLNDLFIGIDPASSHVIETNVASRETNRLGDDATKNGYMGNMFKFFDIDAYMTNNYLSSRTLDLATNPTNGDTLTITLGTVYGPVVCTFTFVSVIGSTAGNVLIGGSADATRANLAALINAPGTTTAQGVGFSTISNEYFTLAVSCSAVNDDAANTLTFYAEGRSVAVAASLTAGGDGWDATKAGKHLMFAQRGAVDMVVQVAPTMQVRLEPRGFESNIMGKSLWGRKTFTDGAKKMVDIFVKA